MAQATKYTDEEINYIKGHLYNSTVKEIAIHLNKSQGSVEYTARKLGLKKQAHNEWKDEDVNFLKENYMTMTNVEIAKKLNRSTSSVAAMSDRLHLTRVKSWSAEDEEYLKQNFTKLTHKEMGLYLHRSDIAVRAKCFELNLYKKNLPWTDEELFYLRQYYLEKTNKELSKVLNRTECAIQLQASRMGMKKDLYSCNYHYFDTIDTEEKAYWLGFLTADGWISKQKSSNSCEVGMELQYSDKQHLKKFNKSISGNYKITDRWRKCPISTTDRLNHTCCIRVDSQVMYNSLKELGLANDKSYSASIPNTIPENLIKHYIRGYFDGDGYFAYTNKSFNIAFISASKNLINDIVNVLHKNAIEVYEHSYVGKYNTITYKPEIYKLSEKIKFLDWIYQDSTIYLDRKYKKYLKAKNNYMNTQCLAA